LAGRGGEEAAELLSDRTIRQTGLFDAVKVGNLVEKLKATHNPSEVDSMALAGVLSTQIIHQQFIEDFPASCPSAIHPDLVVDRRTQTVSRCEGVTHG
jgi:asparagine synthase (glutamine-hydrolysing)